MLNNNKNYDGRGKLEVISATPVSIVVDVMLPLFMDLQ